MAKGNDIFYDARLVEETRTHFATILEGRYSEPFFYCFFKIIQRKVYLGYYTYRGREVKLKGIVDFIFSKHYGLGLNGIDQFILPICDVMIYDETESQYARQILKWLKKESSLFKLPKKAHEFERLLSWVRYRKGTGRVSNREIRIFIKLYNSHPEFLERIGQAREFRTFEQAGIAAGIVQVRPGVSIRINRDMTGEEYDIAAEKIYNMLGPEGNCRLIERLISIQKNDKTIQAGYTKSGGDAEEDDETIASSLCERIRISGDDGPGD